jgi:hypothetical protein
MKNLPLLMVLLPPMFAAVRGKEGAVKNDTSTIPPQAATGATSNKILLNFVNFENSAQTLDVRVTLPQRRPIRPNASARARRGERRTRRWS